MTAPSTARRIPVLMHVATNERVHKVFVIHDPPPKVNTGESGEFRVITKERADGNLELLGYHYRFDGENEFQTNVLRAPTVPQEKLLPLIRNLVAQTRTDIKQMDVSDLTTFRTRLDQADRLAQLDLLDAFDFE